MKQSNELRQYTNDDIIVFWDYSLCEHDGTCFLMSPRVFDPKRRPWIVLEQGKTKQIIKTINACPTKALTFRWKDVLKNDAEKSPKCLKTDTSLEQDDLVAEAKAQIQITCNGPIVITGPFQIYDSKGVEMRSMKMISLCRCGVTKKPPYCDGTHVKIKFKDEEDKV